MADVSVSDFACLLNKQIETLESLDEYLTKLSALLEVTLNPEFLSYNQSTIHNYLWALDGIVLQAFSLNRQELDASMSKLKFLNQN